LVGNFDDFCFSEKARKAGFHIWSDYGILCSHFKETDAKILNTLRLMASKGKYGQFSRNP